MLWWISFFNYADRQAIFSVFPLLESEMGLTLKERGYLGTSFAVVYGVSALFAGMVVDRVRRKTAILGGLQVWSLICMTTAVSRNYIQLLLFRAAEGLGETFYYPASTSLLSDYHGPATRSRALGLHQTSVYIGTIAGGFLAGFIALHYGWRGSFVFFGGLGMVLGVILQFTLLEPPRGAAEDGNQPARKRLPLGETIFIILRTPAVPFFMLAFACSNYAAMVLLSWMPQYLSSKFNLRLDWAGLGATGPPQLASMLGAPLGGWLADVWRSRRASGRAQVQALAVFACAPFVYLCGHTESLPWFFFFLASWGFFKGFYDANIFAAVFDVVPPEARGTVAGFMNTFGWLLGGAAAPTVVGWLGDEYGLGPAIGTSAAVYLAAGCLLLVASRFLTGRKK
ncbi:MAG TPA: MFS transporter [Gemmataceae bacterium]|jgi:MFS family permease|nr:MFS transporter [Gemmataceae bacterium]